MLTPLNMVEHLLFKRNIKNPSTPVFCQVLLPLHGIDDQQIKAFSFTNAWNEHVWCWSVMLKCDSWTSMIPASLLVTAFALCLAAISSTICQNIWLYSVLPYRIGDVPVVSGREWFKTTHIWYMKYDCCEMLHMAPHPDSSWDRPLYLQLFFTAKLIPK